VTYIYFWLFVINVHHLVRKNFLVTTWLFHLISRFCVCIYVSDYISYSCKTGAPCIYMLYAVKIAWCEVTKWFLAGPRYLGMHAMVPEKHRRSASYGDVTWHISLEYLSNFFQCYVLLCYLTRLSGSRSAVCQIAEKRNCHACRARHNFGQLTVIGLENLCKSTENFVKDSQRHRKVFVLAPCMLIILSSLFVQLMHTILIKLLNC